MIIPSTGSIDYTPTGVVFEDGFEYGDFSAWTGVRTKAGDIANVEQVNPYEGKYHARFYTNGTISGTEEALCYHTVSPERNEIYARGYYYIASGLPLDDNDDRFGLLTILGSTSGWIIVNFRIQRVLGVDKFFLIMTSGEAVWATATTEALYPQSDTWYCFELYFKVHSTEGEGRVWIDGVEYLTITGKNTAHYGNIDHVGFGLVSTNVQHYVEIYGDCAVLGTSYIGPLMRARPYAFGVVGPVEEIPAIRNFYWLFGNQSIRYKTLQPSEVTHYADVDCFDGLVIWTKPGYTYNATAIKQFAQKRIVISHIWDFCNMLYPSLSDSTQVVTTKTVTYVRDWGNFRNNDLVEMHNETGNTNQLTTVLASNLEGFINVTHIACFDASRIAFFHMIGVKAESGFYVMDLHATTPETEWAGIWHLFPAIKMVRVFPTGKYARWLANGQSWWDLTWIYNRITAIVNENNDIAEKWIIGQSVEDRGITAIVIGTGSRYMIIDGCIHGNEKTTAFASLRIAELLIEYYRSSPSWQTKLEQYKVIIIPVLNPDGYVASSRYNAHGVDLNRNFPPGGTTTEPEAWALRWLMGNYTPTVYINQHTGYYWYPLNIFFGQYEAEPFKTFTDYILHQANNTLSALRHWGWFTEEGRHVWIGKVRQIGRSGLKNSAQAYASWKYDASTTLAESFVWSRKWGARQGLWGIDYYCSLSLTYLEHYDYDGSFLFRSDGFITSTKLEGDILTITLDTRELTGSSTTVIQEMPVRGKPIALSIDGITKDEGDGWTYSEGIFTITGAKNSIKIAW